MSVAHYYETMDYGPAPEADGEARAWLKRHDATFGHFISGKFDAPASGKHLTTIEPATGKALAKIAQGAAAEAYPELFAAVLDKPYPPPRLLDALNSALARSGKPDGKIVG